MSAEPGTLIPAEIAEGDILASREAGGRFLRGGSLRVMAYGAGLLVGLLATPLVTRHLGPADWGHYITVSSVIFIAVSLTEGGVGSLGVREYANGNERAQRELIGNLLGLRIALSLAAAMCAIGFALLVGYPSVLVEGIALASVGVMLETLRATLGIVLTVRLRLGWLAVTDFTGQFVTALLMVILVVAGARLLPFLAVSSGTAVATLAVTTVLVRREVRFVPSFSPARWRSLLAGSLLYAAATSLGVIYFRIVVVAVSLLANKKQDGYFGLSFRIIDIINGIPWLLVASAFPILARAALDEDRLRYALQRLFDGSLVIGGLFSLCVIIGAPFAVDVVGGGAFHPSIGVLRILGIGVTGTFLVATWSYTLLTLHMYRELILVNGLAVILAVVLCLALIPGDQARGAGVVTATLELALAAGYATALGRRRADLRPSLRLLPRIGLALAIGLAMGALLPLPAVAATILAALAMLASLFAMRAVPAEFLQALR